MATRIKTSVQHWDRPTDWRARNKHRAWRCDIFTDDGSDHHGEGATEAEAIYKASLAYLKWASAPTGDRG